MMRKIIAIALCLCVLAPLLSGCGGSIQEYEEPEDATGTETTEPAETEETAEPDGGEDAPAEPAGTETTEPAEPTTKPGLGYAAYGPDEITVSYNDQDITWREYYYWLSYYAGYMQYMTAMGAPFSGWDANDYAEDMTNGELVLSSAADSMFQYHAIGTLAEKEGLTVDQDALQSAYESSADSYGDGDGECTEEEAAAYEEYLDGQFVDRELFDFMTGAGLLWSQLSEALYGKDGAEVSDEEALAYAEELDLLACKHILLMTVDPETGEALSEEEIAEKKAEADELYKQLADVQDDPEALEALFDELMNEHSEDTGLAYYPDGYLFTAGVMVPVFEETTADLEEYGLSEPVESDYGYHIILRLPVDPDGSFTDASGSSSPLRAAAASAALAETLEGEVDAASVVWKDGFETVDIAEIFGE